MEKKSQIKLDELDVPERGLTAREWIDVLNNIGKHAYDVMSFYGKDSLKDATLEERNEIQLVKNKARFTLMKVKQLYGELKEHYNNQGGKNLDQVIDHTGGQGRSGAAYLGEDFGETSGGHARDRGRDRGRDMSGESVSMGDNSYLARPPITNKINLGDGDWWSWTSENYSNWPKGIWDFQRFQGTGINAFANAYFDAGAKSKKEIQKDIILNLRSRFGGRIGKAFWNNGQDTYRVEHKGERVALPRLVNNYLKLDYNDLYNQFGSGDSLQRAKKFLVDFRQSISEVIGDVNRRAAKNEIDDRIVDHVNTWGPRWVTIINSKLND